MKATRVHNQSDTTFGAIASADPGHKLLHEMSNTARTIATRRTKCLEGAPQGEAWKKKALGAESWGLLRGLYLACLLGQGCSAAGGGSGASACNRQKDRTP